MIPSMQRILLKKHGAKAKRLKSPRLKNPRRQQKKRLKSQKMMPKMMKQNHIQLGMMIMMSCNQLFRAKSLERVYLVHPGLQSRFFLATFGRFFLGQGLYWKIEYVSRVGFLWDYMKKDRIQVPDFVYKHDKELERRPLMDYGLDADPFVAVEMDPALYVKNGYRLEGMHAASYCQLVFSMDVSKSYAYIFISPQSRCFL